MIISGDAMSWWAELVEELAEAIKEAPFERRTLIAPSTFARRSLRVELASELGRLGLPLSGLSIVAPHEVPELFEIKGQLRSSQQLRIALLEAFANDSDLLGNQALGGWRDQLDLARALLDADLEAIDPAAISGAFAHRPKLLRFIQTVLSVARSCSGHSALSLAEAATSPKHKVWCLPLPPLPYRLQALIDRLDPSTVEPKPQSSGFALAARSHDQMAKTVMQILARHPRQRIALVVLDPALMAPLEERLTQAQLPWASAQRVGLGLDPDQRAIAKLSFVDSSDTQPLEVWRADLADTLSPRVLEAADELCTLGSVRLAGGAFIDELQKMLGRGRPSLGWPQSSLHLLDASSWPDSAYEHVLILGTQRGYLAQAMAQRAPLLSPNDRTTFQRIGLDAFDPELAIVREQAWLDAWRAASETLSVGWITHDGKGRRLAADRWAVSLSKELQAVDAAEVTIERTAAPNVQALGWQVDEPTTWFPTTVSNILRCPRQAFLQKQLKLRGTPTNEGLELFSDAMWTGNLLHSIVERAARPMITNSALLENASDLLRQATAYELARHEPAINDGLQAVLLDSLWVRLRPLAEFFESGQVLSVLGVETYVPEKHSDAAFHARCDLIIEDHEGRRVLLDLKSGSAKSASDLVSEEAGGKSLQRAAYLIADQRADLAAMFYLGGGQEPYLPIDSSDSQIPWALEALERAKEHFKNGTFPMAGSSDNETCGNCDVRSACRRFDSEWLDTLTERGPKFEGTIRQAVKKANS
jgi:hypothetical protein